jgi:hypothetical protein
MNIPRLSILSLTLFMLYACTISCGKQDLFKDPTSVSFYMGLDTLGVGGSDDLILDAGYIVLSSFRVIGERNEGEDFEFFRAFSTGLQVPFMHTSSPIADLQFELPEGNYNKITIRFETHSSTGINLFVSGKYTYSNPLKPSSLVRLEYNSSKQFEVDITDVIGNTELTLIENKEEKPQILLNPKSWFQDVNTAMLDNATFVSFGTDQIMTIDDGTNTAVFNKVDLITGVNIKCTF